MIVKAKGGGDFEMIPIGLHPAILIWQVDIGSVENKKYNNWQRKVILTWELPEQRIETDKGNQPKVLSKVYTASLSEKSYLHQDLVAWRGRKFTQAELDGFDLGKAVGRACFINIAYSDDGKYENIVGLAPNNAQLQPENPLIVYDLEADGLNIPKSLPQWLQDKIMASPEYEDLRNARLDEHAAANRRADPIPDSDVPF